MCVCVCVLLLAVFLFGSDFCGPRERADSLCPSFFAFEDNLGKEWNCVLRKKPGSPSYIQWDTVTQLLGGSGFIDIGKPGPRLGRLGPLNMGVRSCLRQGLAIGGRACSLEGLSSPRGKTAWRGPRLQELNMVLHVVDSYLESLALGGLQVQAACKHNSCTLPQSSKTLSSWWGTGGWPHFVRWWFLLHVPPMTSPERWWT